MSFDPSIHRAEIRVSALSCPMARRTRSPIVQVTQGIRFERRCKDCGGRKVAVSVVSIWTDRKTSVYIQPVIVFVRLAVIGIDAGPAHGSPDHENALCRVPDVHTNFWQIYFRGSALHGLPRGSCTTKRSLEV